MRPHKKGRKKTLDIHRIKTQKQEIEERVVDTSAEHVKRIKEKLGWLSPVQYRLRLLAV